MRDILIIAIVIAGSLTALRHPWIGILLWTWLSILNPHRYAYGVAYSAPLAAIVAVCVAVGLLTTRQWQSPFKGTPVTFFVLFMGWITLSWLLGLDVIGDYEQWKKIMKIDVMLLLALMLLDSKKHIFALMWVCVGSLAVLGVKGGIFTILTGGSYRVWGPPASFIGDNNEFALALIMAIPLVRFLQLNINSKIGRWLLTGVMILCTAAALGSQSRGALLAVSAMAFTLWWRGKNKVRIGIALLMFAVAFVSLMPEEWYARMSTINAYESDRSAMGRISAWWNAWNIAWKYPIGVGLNPATPELFLQFSPYPDVVLAAHSIYFQIMGNHGFLGLFLFMAIWYSTWRAAGELRTQDRLVPEARWTADLGAMCQVSLVGYAVGGAFLSLAYFDLPYDVMIMVVLTRLWVQQKKWQSVPTLVAP